jgi:hypothetical protein
MLAIATILAIPGNAAPPPKGALVVISISDTGTGLTGAVKDRPFTVVVEARDNDGQPLPVTRATTVTLSSSGGPGVLGGTISGVIAKNATRATISGATYSAFANDVALTATATSGLVLTPAQDTMNVAVTAVRAEATPRSDLTVTDPGCAAPTPESPMCGYLLLPNGGNGQVLMSVGSCEGILDCRETADSAARLITADVSLKDEAGAALYSKSAPATFILACDKSLCGQGGVPNFPVLIDVTNNGDFFEVEACPAKGVLSADQTACHDTRQSTRDNAGDLYSYVLFDHDIRGSYP